MRRAPSPQKRSRLLTRRRVTNTAITNVYRARKDLSLTQRFARHANPITTRSPPRRWPSRQPLM